MINEGESIDYTAFDLLFSDIDDTNLQFEVGLADGSPLPAWLSFDPSSSILTAQPGFDDAGTYSLLVSATDAFGEEVERGFDILVNEVNRAPTGLLVNEVSVDENTSNVPLLSIDVLDPDTDDDHTVQVDDPRFEVVDGVLWLVDGNPLDHETENTLTLNLELTDSAGELLTVPFVVNVNDVNEIPVLAAQAVPESAAAPFTVTLPENLFADEDSDEIQYSVTLVDGSPAPEWLIFDSETLQITFTEDAPADTTQSIVIVADDGRGGVASTIVDFIIEPVIAAAAPAPIVAPTPQIEVADSVLQIVDLTPDPVSIVAEVEEVNGQLQSIDVPVSYTHLTLPTTPYV